MVAGLTPDPPGVDLVALGRWMDSRGLPEGPVEQPRQLAGGTQNVLVHFVRAGQAYVLRRPPVHKRANSDETMRREARVLAALAGSDVPHPRLIASCPDDTVLGAAFYLMEPVDGTNPNVELAAGYADPAWRHGLGLAMADAAATLGAVDHAAVGLSDLGRADGWLERQVARWRAHLDGYRGVAGYDGPDIPGVEQVGTWLEANRPTSWRPGLIHGDYHLSNVMATRDRPGLAAIVDWELATIGDPLLDLGWLLATWPSPDGRSVVGSVSIQPWEGFPTAAELVARYGERSDRDVSYAPWYEVLACYKLGIILEGTYVRACAGQAPQETGDLLHASTLGLFARARARIAAS